MYPEIILDRTQLVKKALLTVQPHIERTLILKTSKWRNYGVRRVYTQYQQFLEALFQLLGGITLSVSLFRLHYIWKHGIEQAVQCR